MATKTVKPIKSTKSTEIPSKTPEPNVAKVPYLTFQVPDQQTIARHLHETVKIAETGFVEKVSQEMNQRLIDATKKGLTVRDFEIKLTITVDVEAVPVTEP